MLFSSPLTSLNTFPLIEYRGIGVGSDGTLVGVGVGVPVGIRVGVGILVGVGVGGGSLHDEAATQTFLRGVHAVPAALHCSSCARYPGTGVGVGVLVGTEVGVGPHPGHGVGVGVGGTGVGVGAQTFTEQSVQYH